MDNSFLEKVEYKRTIGQFSRFVVVGIINTTIDYSVLFLLSKITSITGGNAIIPLNIISFSCATFNSYFLNKLWAFHDQSHIHQGQKVSLFLLISIGGVLINTAIVHAITTNILPQFNFSPREWLFAAKVVATGASLIWNFTGYKYFVFKK